MKKRYPIVAALALCVVAVVREAAAYQVATYSATLCKPWGSNSGAWDNFYQSSDGWISNLLTTNSKLFICPAVDHDNVYTTIPNWAVNFYLHDATRQASAELCTSSGSCDLAVTPLGMTGWVQLQNLDTMTHQRWDSFYVKIILPRATSTIYTSKVEYYWIGEN